MKTIKSLLEATPAYHHLRNLRNRFKYQSDYNSWQESGCPVPPPHLVKQKILRKYAESHNLTTLVETGTFLGDMVQAMRDVFQKIYSIELSPELYLKAARRFKSAPNVSIINGDSGTEISNLLKQIKSPTLFWLDGHYSGESTAMGKNSTPILEELKCILGQNDLEYVVVIDDARCFGTDPDYPTLEELKDLVDHTNSNAEIITEHDTIGITKS